ncbi:histidine kinase [Pedobacter psychrotolerans]|uniref:Histidine kinase n=1 Tax=Pedobacter psychrotolerans TaxID=1843235 RepID=A0A4R2HED8_9SPHI|nr:histidine kinase [Pedobacter psychrotolerans]TCO26699.1 histidine kinase [Pedobacter psychrotolerans]GGE55817.1 hypothetical protein GCM10011413_22730 [Pedobacter psychrotolerans]
MKKIFITFFSFIFVVSTVFAQKIINFSQIYSGGRKLGFCVDSSAKNIYYDNKFPNQPNTSFTYLPEVNNISIQAYFDRKDDVRQYRYTILVDNKPIVVNKSINKKQLTDIETPDLMSFTKLGVFAIKGKNITTLIYNINKPLDIYKSVFYAKPIPRAKIVLFSKLVAINQGEGFTNVIAPKERTSFSFSKKDIGLRIIKNKSDIDYLYYVLIKNKLTNKIIFRSTYWEYGSYIDANEFLPYVKIDKSIFKKSGDYEIIIQPFINENTPLKEIEKYTTRYTLALTLDEPRMFSGRTMLIFGIITPLLLAAIFVATLIYTKRKNEKKLAKQYKEKEIAQLQLNSVRSQLNPHFLFNALAGIQNLMNKHEIDKANRYLSKFARLTRNVLDSQNLINLTGEKTLLDDYLQMEQLRFGFNYTITASTDIDTENIEIPSMLLQPFVENAVKHGIAENGVEGKIEVSFDRKSSDLLLKIVDNGKGFTTTKTYNGLGLSLSKNRISLLNTIYKDAPFVLDIQSSIQGTAITITLTQWL